MFGEMVHGLKLRKEASLQSIHGSPNDAE